MVFAANVYTYEQRRSAGDEKFTTVSLFVVTDEGVLVADGQGNPEETKRLVDRNVSFPDWVSFFAHPTSRATLVAAANRADRPADAPPVLLPTEMVEEKRVLDLGGREIQILFLGRAHTGRDLNVFLPDEKILFMSEAYLHLIFPAMRSAYPSEWVEMIRRAQAMDVDIYVPGHGFVDSPAVLKEELQNFRRSGDRRSDAPSQWRLDRRRSRRASRFRRSRVLKSLPEPSPRAISKVYQASLKSP